MPNHVHRVVNHFKYWRSNWTVVASSFILTLSGVLVAGTIARAGENALAYYGYPQTNNGCQTQSRCGGGNACQSRCGGSYPMPTQPVSNPCGQQCGGNYQGYVTGYAGYGGNYQGGSYPGGNYPGGGYPPGGGSYPGGPGGDQGPGGPGPDDGGGMPSDDDNGQQPPEEPEPTPSESPAPVNNNQNYGNNSTNTATANVILGSTVRGPAPPAPSGDIMMLPETGPADGIVQLAGIGSLVAAGTAYVASRRELFRTVFRK